MTKTKKADQKTVEAFGSRLYNEAEKRKIKMEGKSKAMKNYYQEKEIEDIKNVYLKNNQHVTVYNFLVN